MTLVIEPMACTASVVPPCTPPCTVAILEEISSVALAVWLARFFTSEATTAKPLPISPARAASMVSVERQQIRLRGDGVDDTAAGAVIGGLSPT